MPGPKAEQPVPNGKTPDQGKTELPLPLAWRGPAPRPLLGACAEKNIPVFQSYGMTEAVSQTVTLAPEDSLRKIG